MKTSKIFYRFQQLIILLAHLAFLYWIVFVLNSANELTLSKVILHFLGLALFGAALIRGTAYWANWHFKK